MRVLDHSRTATKDMIRDDKWFLENLKNSLISCSKQEYNKEDYLVMLGAALGLRNSLVEAYLDLEAKIEKKEIEIMDLMQECTDLRKIVMDNKEKMKKIDTVLIEFEKLEGENNADE